MKLKMKNKRPTPEELALGRHSQWGDVWRRLRKNKLSFIAMFVILALILVAVFANFLAPYDYAKIDVLNKFQRPNGAHWFGTDEVGRDIFSRIIYGARTSLLISLLATVIGLVLGTALGATAGFFGGKYETIVMRCIDVLMAMPSFLLAVSVSAALGTGLVNTAIAISVTAIPAYCRLVRASVISIKGQEYIEAARSCGFGNFRTILRHVLPNSLAPIIVESTLRIGGSILSIASLSFIGLGVQAPAAEWGSMLSAGRAYIRDFWPLSVFPGLAIMLTLFAFNLFGDGLRDSLDPKLRK